MNHGDVRQRLLDFIRAVDRRAVPLGEAGRDGPGEERDAEFGGQRLQQFFEAVFFSGLDGDDGISRIDEQAQFVMLLAVESDAHWRGVGRH
jgi:hypothetical protein